MKYLFLTIFYVFFFNVFESSAQAPNKEEQEARELFAKGNEAFKNGKYKLATDFFSKSISKAPNKPAIYFNRGSSYALLKDYLKAIRDFTKTIELSPKHFDAYNNRGLAYYDIRQFDKALSDFNRSLEIDSNFVIAMVNKGITLEYVQRYTESLSEYEKALSILEEDRPEVPMIQELIRKVNLKIKK